MSEAPRSELNQRIWTALALMAVVLLVLFVRFVL